MTVSRDGAGKNTPANSSEWTEVGGIVTGVAVPDHLYDCQQGSGADLLDVLGSINLNGFGTYSFLQSVPGWTRKAVRVFTGSSGFQCFNTGDPLGDPASHSHMALLMVAADAATSQIVLEFGGGVYVAAGGDSGISHDVNVNLVQPSSFFPGTIPFGTAGRVMLIQFDRAHSKFRCRITEETITPTFVGASADFNRFVLGNQGGATDTHLDFLYCAVWRGTSAEIDDATFDGLFEYIDGVITPGIARTPFWGPNFPDAAHTRFFFGTNFPDGIIGAGVVPPFGPGGIGTFAIDLQSGTKVTWSWVTDIIKTTSGLEYRAGIIDSPKTKFDGTAILVDTDARQVRAQLAKSAAKGAQFLLGLSYEELTATGPATNGGIRVPVNSTLLSDWANIIGQRLILQGLDGTSIEAVLQDSGSSFLELDTDVSAVTKIGTRIIPTTSVLLEPTQGFLRYPTDETLETWELKVTSLSFGFQSALTKAKASLSTTTTLPGAFIQRVLGGADGNTYTITLVNDSGTDIGSVTNSGHDYTFHYKSTVTTVAVMAFQLGALFGFIGTFTPSDVLVDADSVGPIEFRGGADRSWGTMGRGATVNTLHDGRPIWDRYVQVDTTAADSVQTMTEIIDMDGVPVSVGTANFVDWGRAVRIRRDTQAEFQWMKAFLSTVNGRRKTFWLPTWRNDLQYHTAGVTSTYTMKISGPSPATGDFFVWYPSQRTSLQIVKNDGTIVYWPITSATNNNDGTITVVSVDPDTSIVNVLSAEPLMISWLELCRFESDDFDVQFDGAMFTMETTARVVQQ